MLGTLQGAFQELPLSMPNLNTTAVIPLTAAKAFQIQTIFPHSILQDLRRSSDVLLRIPSVPN